VALWNGARVPFTLLGGYLGAGKTTIVNHIVGNPGGRRIVVLVNDVAAVNVDATLVADHDGTTLSLTNGCVCCAIADDFAQTLEQIRAMPEPPDHVLMELSGVGEPARVAPWASTAGFRLDGIVVAADAEQVVELAAREYVGDTIVEQLGTADLVLLTKTDLAADGGPAARALIVRHTPAPIIETRDGVVDVDIVLGVDRSDIFSASATRQVGSYETAVIDIGTPTQGELERLLADLPANVIRAKGLIRCADVEVPVEAHVVGTRRTVRRRADLDVSNASGVLVLIRCGHAGAAGLRPRTASGEAGRTR
jgi:G3E family GTPase